MGGTQRNRRERPGLAPGGPQRRLSLHSLRWPAWPLGGAPEEAEPPFLKVALLLSELRRARLEQGGGGAALPESLAAQIGQR